VLNQYGEAEIIDVATVGEDKVLVHDEHREDPTVAFALSRLSSGPTMPTPIGVFRQVERPDYGAAMQQQLVAASQSGPGDLQALLESAPVWEVVAN
jgi:2-oxoglutarate ferredoxin oxidoreductase subunit beta